MYGLARASSFLQDPRMLVTKQLLAPFSLQFVECEKTA